jgi:RES domain-containing protein
MPTVSRLVKSRHAAKAFDGEGARLYGGRWSSPGTAVVYTSETVAVAMLEILVHVAYPPILDSYSRIEATFPDAFVEDPADLPRDWNQSPPPTSTQAIGDTWARDRRSAALRVPSAVVPRAFNFLLNPDHPDFLHVVIGTPEPFTFDPRLLR